MRNFFIPIRHFGESLSRASLIFLLLPVLFVMNEPAQASQKKKPDKTNPAESLYLEKGRPVEKTLTGGQSHSYQIKLSAGRYLQLVVEQRGIDVVVTLTAPDGKQVLEVDSPNGTQGAEPVEVIAEASGKYRLEIKSLDKDAPAGRYEIKEKYAGANNPDVAIMIGNLALMYSKKGDLANVEKMYRRALEIKEKTAGSNHPDIAAALNNLKPVHNSTAKFLCEISVSLW